jgi:hypothetical protein
MAEIVVYVESIFIREEFKNYKKVKMELQFFSLIFMTEMERKEF